MAKTLQFRRGTTSELSTQSGAVGELFVDTTKDTVVVMDGSTAGGFPLATESSLSSYATTNTVNQGLATKQDTLLSGTNIKTVNGTSLLGSGDITISGGSGGTSYDQDLNTTDDVVFNSALIGDVSIIGNEISAVDSYGNTDTLVVGSNLNVQFGEQGTTTTQTIYPYQYGNSGTRFVFQYPGYVFKIENSSTDLSTIDVSPFALGSVIRYNYNGQTLTFTLTSDMTWTGSSWNASVSGEFFPNVGIYGDITLYGYTSEFVQVTSTIDTLVTPLTVTETGVAVEGAFTVNGSPVDLSTKQDTLLSGTNIKTVNGTSLLGSGDITITGGSGSSFDQDLNTTDDVVFNSALVGDVSIIGNEITAIDSYGNDATLAVSSEMQVTVGSISTVNGNPSQNTIRLQLYSYDVSFFIEGAGTWYFNEDFVRALYNNNPDSSPVVSVTFPGPIGMPDTVITGRLKANNGGYPGEWQLGNTNPATVTNIYFDTNYLNEITINETPVTSYPNYGQAYSIGQQVTFTTGSQTTPLSVTASGVNIDGTFTVNGQPVSGGSSFDQDLNTTDDVVFNSALIGDVSIVSNTISAVDAYGNADTLVVASGLEVDMSSSQTVNQVISFAENTDYFAGGNSFLISNGYIQIYTLTSGAQSTLFSLPVGTVITKNSNGNSVVLVSQFFFVGGNTYAAQVNLLVGVSYEELDGPVTISYSQTTEEINTPLSVTASGVNVNGTFTVNGQPVGGSGSSYDQDLNTTDDVVFNSALIGDVSIIGNEISAVDSYGNADTLVVDGELTVSAGTVEVVQTIANTITPGVIQFGGYQLTVSTTLGYSLEEIELIASIPSGTVISMSNISVPSQGWFVATGSISVNQIQNITPNSLTIITNSFVLDGFGNFQGSYLGENITSSEWSWSQTVTVDVPLNTLVADASGVAVEGTLTVNGQEITPSITYDQDLNTTDDVVFNSALIGDVSIVSNTISAVDAYGNSNELVVDGDLDIQGDLILADNTEAPLSQSTAIKYARVVVAGQTYLMPLYAPPPPPFSLSTREVISGGPTAGAAPTIATNGTNLFVAVADNSFATSSNGTSWSNWSTLRADKEVSWNVHYVNGQFVAIGFDPFGVVTGCWISVFNGTSWGTASQMASGSYQFNSIAHNGTIYVAVGINGATGNPVSSTSSNGTTWTGSALPGASGVYGGMNSIIHTGSSFVTVGYNGYYYVRPDSTGIWSSATQIPSSGGSSDFKDLVYSQSLGLYVAVGSNFEGGANAGDRPVISTSTNGTTWTDMTTVSTIVGPLNSVTFGNGEFLAVGVSKDTENGNINAPVGFSSRDGVSWNRTVLGSAGAGSLLSTTYGVNKFVAVGREFTGGQVIVSY
jgi:hypothetical protein